MLGDEECVQDGKYRNYVVAMEKALKNFEYSAEWPDLINSLTKLNKVIATHSQKYKAIPRKLLLAKRLSQCLNPNIPSGVHLKVLETYDLIFKSIGTEKLRGSLFIYATGLFPLGNYAGLSVKPHLLKIYENYLLPLGEDLIPCLDGFLQGILLGMEEGSADNQRSSDLLDSIKCAVSPPIFYTVLWKCICSIPKLRQASITYLIANRDIISGKDLDVVKLGITACLNDANILVQRLSLELLSTRELLEKEVELVKTALKTLLRRDSSLNRRLFNWLTDCDTLVIEAIQSLLCDNDDENYRVLVYLFDKQSKGCDVILKSILIDVIRSMYIHNTSKQIATTFFTTLNSHYVWDYLFTLVSDHLCSNESASVQKPGSGQPPLPELCLLITFVIQNDFLDSKELHGFSEKLLLQIKSQLTSFPLPNLICILNLCKSIDLVNLLQLITTLHKEFVSRTLFEIEVEPMYGALLPTQYDSNFAYEEDEGFQENLFLSIQQMCIKATFNLPQIPTNPDTHVTEAFKVMNELLLVAINSFLGENIEDTLATVYKCLAIAITASSKGVGINAIYTLQVLLARSECRQILNATAVIEQIVTLLWENGDLSTLQDFIRWFPKRIERIFITKTEDPDFEQVLNRVKTLLNKGAPFDFFICKVLDGLYSQDARIRSRSELFVREYFNSVGIILMPLLRILFGQLKLSTSVLSSDCQNLRENKVEDSALQEDASDGDPLVPQISAERPKQLLMDSKGRFTIPVITGASDEDEFDDIDEDNYLGLLDSQSLSRTTSIGDINHNDTKSLLDASASPVICLSVTSIDPEKELESPLHELQTPKVEVGKIDVAPAVVSIHPRLFSIHPYTTHMFIYKVPPDLRQMLYALRLLRSIMEYNLQDFLLSISSNTENDSGVTYLEIMLETVLKALQSYVIEPDDTNLSVHIEALRIIELILRGFAGNVHKDFLGSIMLKQHLPRTILHIVVTLPTLESEQKLTSTEEIMKLNYGNILMAYREVVKVTTALIAIESELKQYRGLKSKNRSSTTYSPNVPLLRQPLYVDSIRQILSDDKLKLLHVIILDSLTTSLPFYKEEKVIVDVVKVLIGILGSQEANMDREYIGKLIDSLTIILHFIVLEETEVSEKVQVPSSLLSNIVSVFVGSTPSTTSNQQQITKGKEVHTKTSLISLLPNLLSSILGIYTVHQSALNNLLNPIAVNFSPQFIQAVGRVEPVAGADLVYGMKVLSLESLISTVDSYLKQSSTNGMTNSNGGSPVTASEETSSSIAVNLLEFVAHYLDKAPNLTEVLNNALALVKNTLTLPLQVQLGGLTIYFKLVKAVAASKDFNKELQDLGGKLLDSICTTSTEKRSKSDIVITAILESLNLHLTPLLDLLWTVTEEKFPSTTIIAFLMTFLRGKFPHHHYVLSTEMMAKLSIYTNLRKSWKKEVFELLLDPSFFHFPSQCLNYWMKIFDNLFSDKATFTEFVTRVSVPQTGSLNIFSSKELEYESRAMLLKRLAFVIYSSAKDQYTRFLTVIQERLAEAIKMPQPIPIIQSQVFLCFRVLLVRLSPQHLSSLWPIILHEILNTLTQMENDVLTQQIPHLYLYLQLCKLLQVALNLSKLPHFQVSNVFQMYRWTFVGPPTPSYTPHLTRLASLLEPLEKINREIPDFELMKTVKIDSMTELYPFLIHAEDAVEVEVLDMGLESDFIE